jgi:NADH-quinone oxidoreductase subunit M
LKIHIRERYAVLALAALILIGGLVPQPGVESRHRAALQLLRQRAALSTEPPPLVDSASHAQAD